MEYYYGYGSGCQCSVWINLINLTQLINSVVIFLISFYISICFAVVYWNITVNYILLLSHYDLMTSLILSALLKKKNNFPL